MKISKLMTPVCAAVAVAAVLTATAPAGVAAGSAAAPATAPAGGAGVRAACGPARARYLRCFSLYAPQVTVNAALAARAAGRRVSAAAATPQGWTPKDIASAYKLPVSRSPGATVGIVDAFSTPDLASDLAVYRRHYGLPACTTATGCLRIVNQRGNPAPLPRADPTGWGVEETLDVSMVSAACPHCKIVVVEAAQPSMADLAAAEDTAARLGAAAISNSYGNSESVFDEPYYRAYDHPGHTIVASSGDSGYVGPQFPSNLDTVTAAGGTELARAHNARGWAERVWHTRNGASGSGCSTFIPKPAWQHDPLCLARTDADVSAVAANLAVYDSSLGTTGPWLLVGGTSAASPLIAGVYALAGNAATVPPGYPYAHTSGLFDVTKGNNDWLDRTRGAACDYTYLCMATKGYNGPTGLGTPDGTSAF
jgi:subtilase family serine protease